MRRLRDRWEAEFLRNEALVALVFAGAAVVLFEIILDPGRINEYLGANRFTVFPILATLTGALLGLVIAAAAIVLDRLASGDLELVKQSRHAPKLVSIFRSAMVWLGAATLLALVLLVPLGPVPDRVLVYAFLASMLLSVVRLARMIWVVGQLMEIVRKQPSQTLGSS
jgi:hypothetical protein